MILIILLLGFALSMFWHFEKQRKHRNTDREREKREALLDLLIKLRKKADKNE